MKLQTPVRDPGYLQPQCPRLHDACGRPPLLPTQIAAREKKKAPGPCELRALLRDAPSIPCTRHGRRRITWHAGPCDPTTPAIARALDRAHNLSRLRDEIETSDHFKGG